MADSFKPNIYPIMYWALMYGLIGGFALFLLSILSNYITTIWFPVFLIGLIWGGFRNYQKQKKDAGHATKTGTPVQEFKAAAKDIVEATTEMFVEQAAEDEQAEAQELAAEQAIVDSVATETEEEVVEEAPKKPMGTGSDESKADNTVAPTPPPTPPSS